MTGSPLILVANPGSASRKFGLYRGDEAIADLHFEWEDGKVICNVQSGEDHFVEPVGTHHLDHVVNHVESTLLRSGALRHGDKIDGIGLRLVAPSSYFLGNHHLTPSVVEKLRELERVAPLHIGIVLKELAALEAEFNGVPIYGISDSGFHASKPDYAWNYGISLDDADKYEIKRYGYHGLSVQSAIHHLKKHDKLANKIVLAHLGSGGSVTALHGGKSLDNTMGYSPLEGLVMATRSGSIDYSATRALQINKGLDDEAMETYLNHDAGLRGIGGSPDVRELRILEQNGDNRARLALATYVYSIQKGIAQMTAALGGIDALVFTGTVGERSAVIRERIVDRLHYLDLTIDHKTNVTCTNPTDIEIISSLTKSKPIYVVHADEALEIARQTAQMME